MLESVFMEKNYLCFVSNKQKKSSQQIFLHLSHRLWWWLWVDTSLPFRSERLCFLDKLLTEFVSCRVSKVKWVHLGLLELLDLRWVHSSWCTYCYCYSKSHHEPTYTLHFSIFTPCCFAFFLPSLLSSSLNPLHVHLPGPIRRDRPHGRAWPSRTSRSTWWAGASWSLRERGHQGGPWTHRTAWKRWSSRTERLPRRERTSWNPCEYKWSSICHQARIQVFKKHFLSQSLE